MICIHAHVSCIFIDVSIASAASPAHTHPSIKEGGASRRFPFVDSFMDGCVWAGAAADAMETSMNMHETCACMHITRNSCGHDISYLFIPGLCRLIQDYSPLIQTYSGLIPGLFKVILGLFQAYSELIYVNPIHFFLTSAYLWLIKASMNDCLR